MKILNLYAGIGGNRKLWGQDYQITAIEIDPKIAEIYESLYPNDQVIIGDAHQYLLENYANYDFIWSSPPCQTHSSFRFNISVRYGRALAKYPDMSLYQEILLLRTHYAGRYVVENVKPYYPALIPPDKILQRHYFWTNLSISDYSFKSDKIRSAQIPQLQELHGIDLSNFQIANKRQILRNCVLPQVGRHIFDAFELSTDDSTPVGHADVHA